MRPLVKSSVSQLYEVEFEGNSSGINLLVSLATLTGRSQLRLPFGNSRFSDEQEQGQNPLQCDRFLLRSNSLHLLGGRKDKGPRRTEISLTNDRALLTNENPLPHELDGFLERMR